MKRLFLAVPIPEKLKSALGKELENLKITLPDWNVNWVTPKNLHTTLIFFGWIEENQIEPLKTELGRAVSSFPSFEITTGKIAPERWTIWLEIEKGREELHQLSEKLERHLTAKGLLKEERGFHPHLTLGRVKKRGKTKLPMSSTEFSWKADHLVLYESRFVRRRRIYEEVSSFKLG